MEPVKLETAENPTSKRDPIAPPAFPASPDDEERARTSRSLFNVLRITLPASAIGILARLLGENTVPWLITGTIIIGAQLLFLAMLRAGKVRSTSVLITSMFWGLGAVSSLLSGGVSSSIFFALIISIIMAGLLIGGRATIVFTVLSASWAVFLYLLEIEGRMPSPVFNTPMLAAIISPIVIFSVSGALIFLTIQTLRESLERARKNEQAQIDINQELEMMHNSLEQQVQDRTEEIQLHSAYLQASIEVSRAAASLLDSDQLINQAVDLIRDKFDLYYVGLFLNDKNGDWAVLKAGTGKAGEKMLQRSHRIAIGSGMIGWSIANNLPRVALESADDSVRLATPELPATRSEAAIPLTSRGKTLGALTVHSDRPYAFGEMEISVFQSLADQLAISLDNAKLYAESQTALDEVEHTYAAVSQQAWQKILRSSKDMSYGYAGQMVTTLPSQWTDEMRQVALSGKSQIIKDDNSEKLLLPIFIRDQVVGVINLTREILSETHPGSESAKGWTEGEISLLESLSEQLGVAMESARLYEDARRRAEREQLTSEITAKVRASNNPQVILQTAVSELRRALQAKQAQVMVYTHTKDEQEGQKPAPIEREGNQTDDFIESGDGELPAKSDE